MMIFKKMFFAGIVITIYIGMATTAFAATPDTIGDFYSPDISSLEVSNDGNNLNIVITCTEDVADYSFYGAVFVDTDQNILTGYSDNGADYVYKFSYMSIIYSDPMITTTLNDDMLYMNTLQALGNEIFITLPLSMLGNDDGNADVFVAVHDQMVKALEFDRAPDYGVIDTRTGKVKIPRTSVGSAHIIDRTGDGAAADIKSIDATVENGFLNLVVTYANEVEPSAYSYGDDITGWVNIDVDQQLATGFANTEQAPPTFGVDYRIEYTTGSMMGTNAAIRTINANSELTKQGYSDTTTKFLGVPYNDGTFKVSENKVFLGIPLVLLGNDDGSMHLTVDSFTIHDSLGGDIDSVPDSGNGAIDTSDGSIKALLSYGNNREIFTDSASDSTGFGYDGDEIISVETGFDEDKMLITVVYSSLSLDDGAITTISFDTNKDGKEDYSIAYSLMYGKLAATMIGDYDGEYKIKEVSHLVTMKDNSIYLSIPSVFLGNDDGNMNIDVETALVVYGASIPETDKNKKWLSGEDVKTGVGQVHLNPDKFGRTLYDRAPDTGSYTIRSNNNYQQSTGNGNIPPAGKGEEAPGFSGVMGIISLIACLHIMTWKKKLGLNYKSEKREN